MTFQIQEGQIFIHKNTAEGNKPVIKGNLMIAGVEYEVALWGSKSGKEGSYSGKVTLPFKKEQPETHKGMTPQGDIPSTLSDEEEITL